MNPLESLVQTGTKLWLDSVDPDEVDKNLKYGATGATSNPIIISGLINTGRFDNDMQTLFDQGLDDKQVAWAMTEKLVAGAQASFRDIWSKAERNDGWVSFELDPLLEDTELAPPHDERVKQYVELAKHYGIGEGTENRMIKVPATPAGLEALEDIAAAGITINVTLIFSEDQYHAARDAIWRGRQKFSGDGELDTFKSVYSIFISRVDVYTAKNCKDLSDDAQGMVGLLNVKRLWQDNEDFWADKNLKLQQEIIFASTGAKLDWQPADYYVEKLAGSGIQTNPPETNDAINQLDKTYARTVDQMPPQRVQDEIDQKVDDDKMVATLMEEGLAKFADPFKKLLDSIKEKRSELASA